MHPATDGDTKPGSTVKSSPGDGTWAVTVGGDKMTATKVLGIVK